MDTKQLIAAVETNESECFLQFGCLPAVKIERTPSYATLSTGQPFWLFNGISKIRLTGANADQHISQWINSFKAQKLPFGVFLYPASQPQDLSERLGKGGFKLAAESTIVAFDSQRLSQVKIRPLPNEFQIQEVDSSEKSDLFFDCFSEVFGLPKFLATFWQTWGRAYGFDPKLPLQNIIITHEGRAVAVATYFIHSNVAGIYSVGVAPAFRSKGLGTHVGKAIAELAAKRGIRYLTGTGSDEGMQVYRKASIQEIGKSQRWMFEI